MTNHSSALTTTASCDTIRNGNLLDLLAAIDALYNKTKPKPKKPKIQLAAAGKLDSEQQQWIKPTLLLLQQHEPHTTASNQTAERNALPQANTKHIHTPRFSTTARLLLQKLAGSATRKPTVHRH
jgi:hypothetical protein